MGLQHGLIDLPHLPGGLAQGHGAGHVGAVSAVLAAEIHSDELALLHLLGAGDAVGQAAVGAGNHDGVEAHLLRTEAEHIVLELGRDLLLGHAGLDKLQDLGKGAVGDLLGLCHQGDLPVVLGRPQAVHQLLGGHQLGGEALLPEVIVRHRQIALLKAQLPDAAAVDDLLHHSPVVAAAAGHGDLRAGDEVIGSLNVAGVGEVKAPLRRHHHIALSVEAHGIVFPGLAVEQHGIETIFRQPGRNLFQMIHGKTFPSITCNLYSSLT